MFYDRFIELCKKRGISPSAVMVSIGLNKSNATFWKKGSIPKGDTLQKLADYFEVSVDYLLGKTDSLPADEDNDDTVFHVGDSFAGGLVTISNVETQEDGTVNVTYSIDENGLSADELMEILLLLKKAHESVGIPPERMIELTTQIMRLSQTAHQPPPAAQEGTDTTPPPEGTEGPGEGE